MVADQKIIYAHTNEITESADDIQMKEQLNFIAKVSSDILKTTQSIIG